MLDKTTLESWLPVAKDVAERAGTVLMRHYRTHAGGGDIGIEIKGDESPVTAADRESSDLIVAALQKLTPHITVVSEENMVRDKPENGLYWTVDPLDGTKGFISRNDHFYVKIALIEDGTPVLGIIHEPVYDRTYYSVRDGAALCYTPTDGVVTFTAAPPPDLNDLRTVFNSLHFKPESYDAVRDIVGKRGLPVPAIEAAKGMCKTAFYMAIATGEADLFVNCGAGPTLLGSNGYSWDYAPDDLILFNAGGVIIDLSTGCRPLFDDPGRKMNAMIGLCDRELGKKLFPELKNHCL